MNIAVVGLTIAVVIVAITSMYVLVDSKIPAKKGKQDTRAYARDYLAWITSKVPFRALARKIVTAR